MKNMKKQTFRIEGLKCPNCKARVESGLKKMDGIGTVEANVEKKEITIEYDPATVTLAQMQEAVDDMGYEIKEL